MKDEFERIIQHGYLFVNNRVDYTKESAYQKYCWQECRTRIQAKGDKEWMIQIWKPAQFPFTQADRAFLDSDDVSCEFLIWNWYAESRYTYEKHIAKSILWILAEYYL